MIQLRDAEARRHLHFVFFEMEGFFLDRAAQSLGQIVLFRLLQGLCGAALIPMSQAVLFDVYGGTWVYERTGEQTFVRRRVVVLFVSREGGNETAVLRSGPREGTQVVVSRKGSDGGKDSVGPPELFGAETGYSK